MVPGERMVAADDGFGGPQAVDCGADDTPGIACSFAHGIEAGYSGGLSAFRVAWNPDGTAPACLRRDNRGVF